MKGPLVLLLVVGLATAEQTGGNPVTKVVELIEELKAKIENDAVTEQKIYDKFACWCETTTKKKAENIETSKTNIGELGGLLLEKKGASSSMSSQMALLAKDIARNEKAQARATAIREKENTDYLQEKAEMEQAIGALEKGIAHLAPTSVAASSLLKVQDKSHKGTLSESEQEMASLKLSSGIKGAINALPVGFTISPQNMALLGRFMKNPAAFVVKSRTQYAPSSETITGILKDMYDTFTANLESETQKEADSQSAYQDIMATKAKELATQKSVLANREAIKAESEKIMADTQQELLDTTQQMKEDSKFFDEAKAACEAKADEWEERSRLRTAELDGINQALETLTSDEARAMFTKSIGHRAGDGSPRAEDAASLVEVKAVDHTLPGQTYAYESLKKAATKAHSLRLASLASSVKLHTGRDFSAVVEEVDKMIKNLEDEEQEDIDQRDWCKETLFQKETELSRYNYKIEKTEAKITKLTEVKEQLEDAIASTDAEILATHEEIAELEATREAENGAFNTAKSDDEAAAELLGVAIGQLSKFYEDEGMDMGKLNEADGQFLQKSKGPLGEAGAGQPEFEKSEGDILAGGGPSFSSGDKSKGESKGIISILTMLKEDCENEIADGIKEEEAAIARFDEQKEAAEGLIASLEEKKTNLESDKADRDEKISEAEGSQEDTEALALSRSEEIASIKPNCDWMLKNFEIRRTRRKAEVKGLYDARSQLSGMGNHAALVQKEDDAASFDDEAFSKVSFSGLSFLQRRA